MATLLYVTKNKVCRSLFYRENEADAAYLFFNQNEKNGKEILIVLFILIAIVVIFNQNRKKRF